MDGQAQEEVRPEPGGVASRALVTAAAIAAVLALAWTTVPAFRPLAAALRAQGRTLGVGALALTPFLSAFLVVEWAALLVPPWRRLRHGSRAGRRRLATAAWLLGLAFAALQAAAMVRYASGIAGPDGRPVPLGPGGALGAALLLLLGAVASAVLADLVDRRGLGSGWLLLLVALAGSEAAVAWARLPAAAFDGAGAPLAALLVPALVALAAGRWLRRPVAAGEATGAPDVPVPTCGAAPLTMAAGLLGLPAALSGWVPAAGRAAAALQPGGPLHHGAALLLAAVLAVILSACFCAPAAVARAWERLDGPAGGEAARRALSRANLRSLAFVAALAALPLLLGGLAGPVALRAEAGATLALVAALALDLAADARAFAGGVPLASIGPLHRVHAAAPALEALRRAGIPATARSRHARALFHFFAPYAPIELLVPADRAAEAAARVRPLLADAPPA